MVEHRLSLAKKEHPNTATDNNPGLREASGLQHISSTAFHAYNITLSPAIVGNFQQLNW